MVTENQCPHCGKPVPATALGGLCPECMLKAGALETAEIAADGTVVTRPSQPAPPLAEIARHFPQLEILECLGRGGMGVVYKARQPKLDRLVALKILSHKREHGITDAEFAERFQREARALARLNHPDIVAVYDYGEAGGYHYLLMEFVDGLTLRQLLQTKKLSPEAALTIVPKICEALQFAHQRGIVHRDIKPENILLDREGRVKITDFGIAKITGVAMTMTALTGAKDVLGTPHYMAPEQLEKPATVDHRADIFSLGVVFYEMLTGELPLGKFQPPSRKVQVDVRLDEVVLHALEKEPDRRYQHASEVKTDVERIASATAAAQAAGPRVEPRATAARKGRWPFPLVVVRNSQRMIHWPGVLMAGLLLAGVYGLAWFACSLALAPFFRMGSAGALLGGVVGFVAAMLAFGIYRSWKLPTNQLVDLDESGQLKMDRETSSSTPSNPPFANEATSGTPSLGGAILAAAIMFGILAGATVLGWFASDRSFSLPAALGAVAAVTMVVVSSGVWLVVSVTRSLSRPPSTSPSPASGLSASDVERIHREVRAPAIGLLVTGILNWTLIPMAIVVVLWILPLEWKGEGLHLSGNAVNGVFATSLVLSSLMIYAGLTMMQMKSRGLAVAASLAAILVTPGNIIGLPVGIWSLVTLARSEVRTAFRHQRGGGLGFMTGAAFVALGILAAFLFQIGSRLQRSWTSSPLRASAPAPAALAPPDLGRAVALFNDIEDFGHEFDAAFNSRNLAAAQTGTRRLLNLLTNFNETTKATDLQFPAGLFADIARVQAALDAGNWDQARVLARHNEEYARAFRRIGERMAELAGEQPATARAGGTATPANVPPVVIETTPPAGAADVDPLLSELRVTFSQDMLTNRMWAVCQVSPEHFPERTGPIHYVNSRTCVVPVKLQPGRTYALWFNRDPYNTFRATNNQPALPYPLFFQTRK